MKWAILILHKELFLSQRVKNVDEWKVFIKQIPLKEYGYLESQANKFAGSVLIPGKLLSERFDLAKEKIESMGVSLKNLTDYGWDLLCGDLADFFDVSSDSIRIRLEVEGLKKT